MSPTLVAVPGRAAPDATLLTLEGAPVDLRVAWQDGAALLVFLRHLG